MLTMRDARAEELPAIVALLADDETARAREDPSLPLDPRYDAAFAHMDRNPDQRLIIAVNDGLIVGTMQLSFLPGLSFLGSWRLQIEAVRVTAARRSAGFGEIMIRWAIEQARARDCRLVQLTSTSSRVRAHAFYERLGFVRSHAGFKFHLRDDAPR